MTITTAELKPCPHCGAGSLARCTGMNGQTLGFAHVERLR